MTGIDSPEYECSRTLLGITCASGQWSWTVRSDTSVNEATVSISMHIGLSLIVMSTRNGCGFDDDVLT